MYKNAFYENHQTDIKLSADSDSNNIKYSKFQCGNIGVHLVEADQNTIERNVF